MLRRSYCFFITLRYKKCIEGLGLVSLKEYVSVKDIDQKSTIVENYLKVINYFWIVK